MILQATAVLKSAQQMARDGPCLWFQKSPVDLGELMIVAAHVASFANQPGHGSQQSHLVLLGPQKALNDPKEIPFMV